MRKLISILLILLLAVPVPGIAEDTQTQTDSYTYSENLENMEGLLQYLKIIETGDRNETLTRGAFARMVCYAAGLKQFVPSVADKVFEDVEVDAPYAGEVQLVKQKGYVSGYSDGTFHPEDEITVMEACVTLLNVLGYGVKAQAIAGGYPNGYYAVISDIGLKKGVSSSYQDPVSRACAVHLIYNALHTELLQVRSVTGEASRYDTVSGETLLYKAFQIKTVSGVINGVDLTSLSGENDLPPYSVYVGEQVLYTGEIEVYSKLGCYVTAYYSDHKSRDFVRYLEVDVTKNKDIVLSVSDVLSIEEGSLTVDENREKDKKYFYDRYAPVIYNGCTTEADFTLALLSDSRGKRLDGTVTLRDNDGDNRAEVVLVDVYENMVVGQIDSAKKVVHDYYTYEKQVSIDENNLNPYIKFYNQEGEAVSASAVKYKNSLQVYRSGADAFQPYIRIYISGATVSGTLNKTGDDNGETVWTIDDQDYKVSSYLLQRISSPILGKSVKVLLNRDGNIVDMNYDSSSGYQWGMLAQFDTQTGLEDTLRIRIYTANGTFAVYPAAKKVTVDGVEYQKMDSALTDRLALAAREINARQENGYYLQMVKFGLNAAGEINYIDTVLDAAGNRTKQDDITPKNEVYFTAITGRYLNSSNAINCQVLIGDSVSVFQYPADLSEESSYTVSGNSFFVNNQDYTNLFCFGDSKDALAPNVFMTDLADDINNNIYTLYMSIVDKTSQVVDENGETALKLYLYTNGASETVIAQNGLMGTGEPISVNTLKPGDIIYYTKNPVTGRISNFRIRYTYATNKISNNPSNYHGLEFAYPYSVKRDGTRFVLASSPQEIPEKYETASYVFKNANVSFYIYDSTSGKKIKRATYQELADYQSAGTECTRMLVHYHQSYTRAVEVFLYR